MGEVLAVPILQGALLCDSARDYNGLVSVLGGFVSIVQAPQLPMAAPIWFAGRVGLTNEELRQEHRIEVTAESDSGEVLAHIEWRLLGPTGAPVPHPDLTTGFNVVTPMPFPVKEVGMYWIGMKVDEEPLVRLPLKVVRLAGAE
jgi:hypothetical protein